MEHVFITDLTAVDWVIVISAALVGSTNEFFTNWSHQFPCAADINQIIQSVYFIYLYMHEFVKTHDSQNIPYTSIYIAYGSKAMFNQRCWL